jgi:hypothetical protein
LIPFDRIELIMLQDGGHAMRSAVRRAHVWAIHSRENQATAESLSRSNMRDQISVSVLTEAASLPDDLGTLIDLAIEHHGKLAEIGIIGCKDAAGADQIMAEYGYHRESRGPVVEYRRWRSSGPVAR